jgi:potassium-dependent mechanosensitive channel
LLWERPIRVNDWIIAGDNEGYVRKINVRSTEIETFDRATIIVPNSNLVSGVVRNRVRNDRTGRALVTLSVPRDTDPELVRGLLMDAAKAHLDVLKAPPPRIVFKKIGDTMLDFELYVMVHDVEQAGKVASDLNFTLHKMLSDAHVTSFVPETQVTVTNLTHIEEKLDDIAEAMENEGRKGQGGAIKV